MRLLAQVTAVLDYFTIARKVLLKTSCTYAVPCPQAMVTNDPSTSRLTALRSGFRLRAPATLTPAKRLKL